MNPHCFCSISICLVMRMAFWASVTEPLLTVLSFSGLTAAQRWKTCSVSDFAAPFSGAIR
ncbi:hypothetical protein [Mesorhizobium sp. C264A]|uniref:hypothetical protein n=1 Tax=Mesorhizobium sp. C264A TaxID=2956825 RepID=UPI00333BDEB0